jgi:hypothetical protein
MRDAYSQQRGALFLICFAILAALTQPPITHAQAIKLHPDTGTATTSITITGTGFGATQGAGTVTIEGNEVKPTYWDDTVIVVTPVDAGAKIPIELAVVVKNDAGKQFNVAMFHENPGVPAPAIPSPGALTIDQTSGFAGTDLVISGKGFGNPGSGFLHFKNMTTAQDKIVTVSTGKWKDTEIDAYAPDFHVPNDTPVQITIQDQSGTLLQGPVIFTEKRRTIANIDADQGVAGDQVTITGRDFPDITTDKDAKVLFGSTQATVLPKSATDTSPNWSSSSITVSAPDLGSSPGSVHVTVRNGNDGVVAQASKLFKPESAMWGDDDETPLDVKMIGGYEQGYQSSQSGSSDGFLAIYGRKVFDAPKIGPYFAVRLLTAPQASSTNNVVSVFTNPSGAITSSSLQGVGSAVDLTVGLEWQRWKPGSGRTTLGVILGGGFVTPLEANSVSATFTMPKFGTVECTGLQARLAPVLTGVPYKYIVPNTTPESATTNNYCFSNTTTSTTSPVGIQLLQYAAPDSPNFYPKYSLGMRMVNRWPGVTGGPKHCTEIDPCERGYVDFVFGQDTSITAGKFKHTVFTADATYPLPVPNLNYLYLFGSASIRFYNLPAGQPPLILASGTTSAGSTVGGVTVPSTIPPSPYTLVVPLAQPDRDFYRFGAGVDIQKIFTALTGASKKQ